MRTWLHFIGKQYYSRAKFIKEAKQYGVTRRVALQQLKQMAFGDMVLLAMMDGKSPVIFGYFIIEKISGLSPTATAAIQGRLKCEMLNPGGRIIKRGCGSYIEGQCLVARASLQEIVAILDELRKQDVDIGLPMVGGEFKLHPIIRLRDIPFRQGFRLFNYEQLIKEVGHLLDTVKTPITVKGQYYVKEDYVKEVAESGLNEGQIQEVINYRRLELEKEVV